MVSESYPGCSLRWITTNRAGRRHGGSPLKCGGLSIGRQPLALRLLCGSSLVRVVLIMGPTDSKNHHPGTQISLTPLAAVPRLSRLATPNPPKTTRGPPRKPRPPSLVCLGTNVGPGGCALWARYECTTLEIRHRPGTLGGPGAPLSVRCFLFITSARCAKPFPVSTFVRGLLGWCRRSPLGCSLPTFFPSCEDSKRTEAGHTCFLALLDDGKTLQPIRKRRGLCYALGALLT